MNYQRLIQNVIVIIIVIVFVFSVRSGFRAGRNIAQTKDTVHSAQIVLEGLDLFYQDQSRFPSTLEFSDTKKMASYFNYFPPVSYVSTVCPTGLTYKTDNQKNFALTFCLSRSNTSFVQKYNTVTERTFIPSSQ